MMMRSTFSKTLAGKMNKKKIPKVMDEWKSGTLHSGSKHGPKVTSRDQAIAIAMSEAGMSKKRMRKHNPAPPMPKDGRHSAMGKMGISACKGMKY